MEGSGLDPSDEFEFVDARDVEHRVGADVGEGRSGEGEPASEEPIGPKTTGQFPKKREDPPPDPKQVTLVEWEDHVRTVLHTAADENAEEVEPGSDARKQRARCYADFLVERFREFPDLAPNSFVDDLPPVGTSDRIIGGFYGYYRRLPGYPGAAAKRGGPVLKAKLEAELKKKKSSWD